MIYAIYGEKIPISDKLFTMNHLYFYGGISTSVQVQRRF